MRRRRQRRRRQPRRLQSWLLQLPQRRSGNEVKGSAGQRAVYRIAVEVSSDRLRLEARTRLTPSSLYCISIDIYTISSLFTAITPMSQMARLHILYGRTMPMEELHQQY